MPFYETFSFLDEQFVTQQLFPTGAGLAWRACLSLFMCVLAEISAMTLLALPSVCHLHTDLQTVQEIMPSAANLE